MKNIIQAMSMCESMGEGILGSDDLPPLQPENDDKLQNKMPTELWCINHFCVNY